MRRWSCHKWRWRPVNPDRNETSQADLSARLDAEWTARGFSAATGAMAVGVPAAALGLEIGIHLAIRTHALELRALGDREAARRAVECFTRGWSRAVGAVRGGQREVPLLSFPGPPPHP